MTRVLHRLGSHSDVTSSSHSSPSQSFSMPSEKSPRRKANGHSQHGDMNGQLEAYEMNGFVEKETPRKGGKGKRSRENSRQEKTVSSSETPFIEDMVAQSRLGQNGKDSGQNSLDRSREDMGDFDEVHHSLQSSVEYDDSGPHREMAVDCPDSFVGTIKTTPRYPPPHSQNSTPRVPPSTPSKSLGDGGSGSGSWDRGGYTDTTLTNAAIAIDGSQNRLSPEQLERLKRHQEELRKRREEESRQVQEQEFLRTSLRGSKKLQALETKRVQMPAGIVNTAFLDQEEEDLEDVMMVDGEQPQPEDKYMRENVDVEDLQESLLYLQNQLTSPEDQEEVAFLQSLFQQEQFQQAVMLHSQVLEISSRSPPPRPVAANTATLNAEVISLLQQNPAAASRELVLLLSNPNVKGLLLAHDGLAEREVESITHIPEAEALDYPLLQYGEDTVKIIHLHKTNEPLGATVRNEGDAVIIGRVVKGGAAEKSGLLHEGDEILEINGIDMKGKNINDVSEMLANMSGTITFMIIPNLEYQPPPTTNNHQAVVSEVHLRALFSYDPEEDPYIPCRELGISFERGDILHVINQDDPNWWQCYREGEQEHERLAGLIPSVSFQEQREAMAKSLSTEGKENKKRSRLCVCGKKDKKKKKKKKLLFNGAGEETEVLTYEEVAKYYPQPNRKRPIVLIGPPTVGRYDLRKRLMESDYDRFAAAVPHTSRPRKDDEVDGKDYHFISRQQFESDIQNNLFIEYGEYEKNWYGTTDQAIREIVNQGKICVLNIYPESLRNIRNSDLKPYIVFVCPPNLEKLRQMHVKRGNARITDEELVEVIEKAREMEDVYGHLFDYVLVNADIDRAYEELLAEINRIEVEPQWVSAQFV